VRTGTSTNSTCSPREEPATAAALARLRRPLVPRGHVTASQGAELALEEIGANTGQTVATVARYVENRAALARAVTRKIIPGSGRP